MKTGITSGENDRFLERYRYLIIASQLLVEQSRPAPQRRNRSFTETHSDTATHHKPDFHNLTLNGALITAAASFVVAWGFHAVRSSTADSILSQLVRVCMMTILVYALFVGLRSYTWRNRSQNLRRGVIEAVSTLVAESHVFDNVTSTALTLMQEIEVVARGYDINQVLPPVTRLEENTSERRCLDLRSALARSLEVVQEQYLDAHKALLTFAKAGDVGRYHDIYDISHRDITEITSRVQPESLADCTSLKYLRYAFRRAFITRQIVLCDLLAVSPRLESDDVKKWQTVLEEVRKVGLSLRSTTATLSSTLAQEDEKQWGDVSCERKQFLDGAIGATHFIPPMTPGKERATAQLRRLDAISHGVRTLHAKIHILRDEATALVEASEDSSQLSSVLSGQYDVIGADIRSLLSEWEKGKSTMLLSADRHQRFSSRSSSSLRSPMSPAPSLGGRTAVEGSPADALKTLMGDMFLRDSLEGVPSDEEVFEAVALPPKRMSMTREEKMSKMQEDRRKRATFHEQANTNTNMLRELETVIKHRPRGRTMSRITST